jgi:hypothetical protein
MASTINATPTSSGLIQTADNTGVLALQTGGTTAITINATQQVALTGNLTVTTGSVSTPAISPTGDSNTGIFFPAADTIAFSEGGTESMRIDSSGNLLVNCTSNTGTASKVALSYNANAGTRGIGIQATVQDIGTAIQFINASGTVCGTISQGTSSTAYNTSSDYRLKENIAPMTGALATVSALKPVTYTWKIDGSDGQGFIAHELQAVVPDCVTGEKDAVETVDDLDSKGNKIGTKEVPRYQGIDTSFLVATLTAAIQELNAKVDAQALEIQTLKDTPLPAENT